MKRSSNSGSPRGDGPRRAGKWDSRPSPRARDERPSRARDERGPRGGSARPASSRPGVGPGPRPSSSRPGSGPGPRPASSRPGPRPAQRAASRPSARPEARRAPRVADPDKLLARQPWTALRPLIPGTDAEIETRLAALRAYAKQLLEWNRGVSNLVSRHDEPRLVERHLRESLFPARLIAESGASRFVDFGSGAGLPAVPLALCGIGEHWTLVESRRNKTLFLRKIKQDFKLGHFDVRTGRLEVLVEEDAGVLGCDAFTSRATAAVGPTLQLATRIVATGGRAFLWKGSSFEQEMAESRGAWESAWRVEKVLPVADGPNVIVVFIRL